MPDDNTDNPYAPLVPVEDKSVKKEMKPVKWFRFVHIAFIVWAAPAFLICISLVCISLVLD